MTITVEMAKLLLELPQPPSPSEEVEREVGVRRARREGRTAGAHTTTSTAVCCKMYSTESLSAVTVSGTWQ